jgi:hypothetical protein
MNHPHDPLAAYDPIAAFRPAGAAAPVLSPREPVRYRAYAVARERPARIDIRPGDGDLCYAPSYASLLNIAYDRECTGVILTFSTMLVKIDGCRLRPVVDALIAGTCQFIEEFDGERYGARENDAPLIERITIHTPGRAGADKT